MSKCGRHRRSGFLRHNYGNVKKVWRVGYCFALSWSLKLSSRVDIGNVARALHAPFFSECRSDTARSRGPSGGVWTLQVLFCVAIQLKCSAIVDYQRIYTTRTAAWLVAGRKLDFIDVFVCVCVCEKDRPNITAMSLCCVSFTNHV